MAKPHVSHRISLAVFKKMEPKKIKREDKERKRQKGKAQKKKNDLKD